MNLMLLVVLVGGAGLLLWAARRVDFGIVEAFGSLFTGWRAEPWPHGVQEEDRDRPWSRPNTTGGAPAARETLPALVPVKAHLGLGHREG